MLQKVPFDPRHRLIPLCPSFQMLQSLLWLRCFQLHLSVRYYWMPQSSLLLLWIQLLL